MSISNLSRSLGFKNFIKLYNNIGCIIPIIMKERYDSRAKPEGPSRGDTLLAVAGTYTLAGTELLYALKGETAMAVVIGAGAFVIGKKTLAEWRKYHK